MTQVVLTTNEYINYLPALTNIGMYTTCKNIRAILIHTMMYSLYIYTQLAIRCQFNYIQSYSAALYDARVELHHDSFTLNTNYKSHEFHVLMCFITNSRDHKSGCKH